ncbi:hypothetical protein PhCBS80983_g05258 [Powellomyces hirtus]|uniref:Endoplasmic reticulum transmembrane protein n=1 Tax=Powellomyces hirtus TaxID=109895 RepID=A0A507DUT0_9FUNG|nr:hypothetical protein PhCBS80983_g05258 [Powellomyces hirtus]
MSLFYQIVFVVLAAEMLLFTLLIAPLPLAVRRPMLKWMSTSPLVTQAKSWLKLVFVYVTIMFVDSLNKVLRKSSNEDHRPDTDPYHRARLFYEQRNLYLTGAVLFLSLLLNRFFAMISELMANETKADALKKQAAKQSTDYLRLLDKDQDHATEISNMKKQIEELSTKAKEVDIIKRQAKQTHDEYMRLTDRYVELERKAGGSDDARKSR